MNKYIIPYYEDGRVGLRVMSARSISHCEEKLMNAYGFYDDDWGAFVDALHEDGMVFGKITDIDEL